MCFSLLWLRDLLIWVVIACVVIALLQVLARVVLPKVVDAAMLATILQIVRHRPGRAEFPHPVLHERGSLAAA